MCNFPFLFNFPVVPVFPVYFHDGWRRMNFSSKLSNRNSIFPLIHLLLMVIMRQVLSFWQLIRHFPSPFDRSRA